ncbi:magnesium transporter MRS2-I-like [Chlorella sorokiniana]|uniref:Magnesium transporter n=1 Tax=Chlorella sorokiniana TaxID=3076 RepID=A0A2P6TNA3_CHLSO|nr:magnesium transporter MRS2-I-like [Chlorella sorokiniana]|eukprot:PRW50815.1 magnesium transporter MRS2-I-like [Chlorella sorokiniana]
MAATEGEVAAPLMLQRRITGGNGVAAGRPPGVPKAKPIVLIDEAGHVSYTTLRKQALVTELQLRHRDIRALDPAVQLPYPSAIFIRKQALVLNLEGLKLLISRDKTLVISVPSPTDLYSRLPPDLNNPIVVQLSNHIAASKFPFGDGHGYEGGMSGAASFMSLEELKHMEAMPYELRALEAALLVLVKILQHEVAALEKMTFPVLARIRRSVARPDLEQLYEIQNKLDKSIARMGKIKEILEELLDDEMQMAGMCLSRVEGGSPKAISERGGSCGLEEGGSKCDQTALDMDRDEVGEAEDLVEAYWLQVDSSLSRLKILQERIVNTEHLVNLDLDAKRNALVALSLAVDLLLMMFEVHMAVTGIFGMNLTSGLERWDPYSLWGVASFGLLLGGTLLVTVGLYAKRKGLLFLPSFGLNPVSYSGSGAGGSAVGGSMLGGG